MPRYKFLDLGSNRIFFSCRGIFFLCTRIFFLAARKKIMLQEKKNAARKKNVLYREFFADSRGDNQV